MDSDATPTTIRVVLLHLLEMDKIKSIYLPLDASIIQFVQEAINAEFMLYTSAINEACALIRIRVITSIPLLHLSRQKAKVKLNLDGGATRPTRWPAIKNVDIDYCGRRFARRCLSLFRGAKHNL
jgi:hypothetical protein